MVEVRIRWLASSERAVAGRLWRELETQLGSEALACSWDWTDVWLGHYGEVVPHRFAVGEADGQPCGIVLVTSGVGRRRGPFRLHSLHLGTAGEPPGEGVFVEYNSTLVGAEHRRAFAAALMDELHRQPRWDELSLDGFAPGEAEPFLLADPAMVAQRVASPPAELRRADIPHGSVLAALPSATRRKVRRSVAALGDFDIEWADTSGHALDILTELESLHQKRWTSAGEPGAFSSPRFVNFHRELVRRLVPREAAILFRVRAASGTVGCLYHFVERGRVLFYQSGLASYEDHRITPGFVVFALCMQACSDRGFVEYDFLAGDSRYKRDLSTSSRELVWGTRRRPALKWQLMDRLAMVKRRVGASAPPTG